MAKKSSKQQENLSKASFRHFMPLVVIAVVMVLVVLGSAVTYAAVVIPKNTPSNILKAALKNSVTAQQVSYGGTITATPTITGNNKYIANVTGAINKTTQAAQSSVSILAGNANVTLEGRIVAGQAYAKVSDLTPIAQAIAPRDANAASLITSLNPVVSNKWISVDESMLSQTIGNCPITSNGFTKADMQILNDAYNKQSFASIASTTDDTVGSVKADKFVVSINNAELLAYAKDPSLKNISVFQALAKCMGSSAMNQQPYSKQMATGSTTFTIWVDKSARQIIQIATSSNQSMIAHTGYNARIFMDFKYQPVVITAPAGAVPVLQLLPELTQTNALQNPDVQKMLGSNSSSLMQLLQQ